MSLCPTGALVEKVPLKKDVPLREKCTATYCTGCAAACAINVFTAGNTVARCEPANGDVICTYGKFALVERCNADRLKVCKADGKAVSLERAAEVTADRISRFSPAEIAVTVCESMTDAELQKAARLSKKLGCVLINLGNLERGIDKDNYKKFEKVFGDRFSVGINREKAVSFGAVDSRAVDFSKIKAVISFGGTVPKGSFEFSAVQSASESGNVSLPLALSVECSGTLGNVTVTPALLPPYGNEDIIDIITEKLS